MRTAGIIIADENEYAPLKTEAEKLGAVKTKLYSRQSISFIHEGIRIIAVQSGIGKVNAATAAAHLISDENPDFILNAGFSGAVSAVRRGEIIAGESYVECDFDISPTGRRLGEKPSQEYVYPAHKALLKAAKGLGLRAAKLGCGDFFLTNRSLALKYKELFDISAFDMESAAIASVCFFSQTPFLSIRKVSDNADDNAVEDYREIDSKLEQDMAKLLLSIAVLV